MFHATHTISSRKLTSVADIIFSTAIFWYSPKKKLFLLSYLFFLWSIYWPFGVSLHFLLTNITGIYPNVDSTEILCWRRKGDSAMKSPSQGLNALRMNCRWTASVRFIAPVLMKHTYKTWNRTFDLCWTRLTTTFFFMTYNHLKPTNGWLLAAHSSHSYVPLSHSIITSGKVRFICISCLHMYCNQI